MRRLTKKALKTCSGVCPMSAKFENLVNFRTTHNTRQIVQSVIDGFAAPVKPRRAGKSASEVESRRKKDSDSRWTEFATNSNVTRARPRSWSGAIRSEEFEHEPAFAAI